LETAARIEAGIDWFSGTLPSGHMSSAALWLAGIDLLEGQFAAGNKAADSVKLGYKGVQCGKIFIGESEQGILIVATGAAAVRAYEHLYIPEMHVSRLDIQVTIWNPLDGDATGVLSEQNARDHKKRGGKGNNRQIKHIADDEGGYTLYIGSRASTSFLRLYNKDTESKQEYYKGAWRYEVEMHNALATQVAQALNGAKESLEASIVSTVALYCRNRGLYLSWGGDASLNVLRPLPSEETDDIRSLRWLSSQVRPTVQRLIHAGYATDVAQALGIETG